MKKSIHYLLLLFTLSAAAQNRDSTAVKYAYYISLDALKKNLSTLASDEYEGRETGKAGQKKAAEYIAQQFKEIGLVALKNNSYFQHYLLNEKQPGAAQFLLNNQQLRQNVDFYYYPSEITRKKIKEKEITFIGYGIDDSLYSDYTNVEVKNKTIMVLSGEPFGPDSVSLVTGLKYIHWVDKLKIKKAEEKGVRLILIVKNNLKSDVQKNKHRLESSSMNLLSTAENTDVLYISKQTAQNILSQKLDIDSIRQQIAISKNSIKIISKNKIQINIPSNQKPLEAENVIGFIEGEESKNEIIIISAHYDHLGIKNGKIFNGADDNASGTSALIELARAFAQAKKEGHGPRRSILFIAFSGEEKGLLGSLYYSQHPWFPLKNTVCNLNIDMVGRIDDKHQNSPNYIYLIGSDKLSSTLHQISETANSTYARLEIDYTYNDEKDKNRFYYRSDHYNFAKNNIPVIFYFNGIHADYHKETDDVEKINFEKIKTISSLVFFTAWELANRQERIQIDSNKK